MKRTVWMALLVVACAAASGPLLAQQTAGNIAGQVTDEQKAALPGVTVTAREVSTGFVRSAVTDGQGLYRLPAVPIGIYDVRYELASFALTEHKGVVVNLTQTVTVDVTLRLASVSETITVTGETPLIETTSSAVGGVVEVGRIESMPLNGRQFANLAVTIPGVALGFHSDPTKSTQFSPQINGGNGRNVNYQIDGGDNNDDTVGGLLQLFPLEAIQEFAFVTSRSKAEFGRSQGGVMNIVTKSGTNNLRGSAFTMFRDTKMNARTQTEIDNDVEKGQYRRYQYGGSIGGPLIRDKIHYFAAAERTEQDTFQAVSTEGLFPELDGVYATPYRETLATTKVTMNLSPKHFLSLRYGRNENSQPYAASPLTPPNGWGDSKNSFDSFNLNHNWVLGGSKLNELIVQYATFLNTISANSADPYQTFPNFVSVGQALSAPQTTNQKKWQFRDDFSWHVTGKGGLGHDLKAGVNFINEPRLYVTFESGKGVLAYTHLDNTISGPLSAVSMSDGVARANIPMKQYGVYLQDDWRLTNAVTLNLGVRYDYMTGYQFDQSKNPNFVKIQAAGKAGLLKGIKGLENAGLDPQEDKGNVQPRIGLVWDVGGNGKNIVRAGWGIYMDMAYTNSNGLFAAFDAQGAFGTVLSVADASGIRNPDGSFYRIGQPISNIASQNQADPNSLPYYGQWIDPRLKMPRTYQTAIGWSHELSPSTVFTADVVRSDGRHLNTRSHINVYIPGTKTRRLAFLNLQPNAIGTRGGISQAKSEYMAGIFGLKRRMSQGVDFTATYTLSSAKSNLGNGTDELNQSNLQDAYQLFDDDRTFGPSGRTDARHKGTLATVIQVKGFTFAPMFTFRSPLPVSITDGRDLNADSNRNDIPEHAWKFTGIGEAPKDIGTCETWNCGRGAWRTQLNLRVSRSFRLFGSAHLEAIGEVFNLLNAKNPSGFVTSQHFSSGADNPDFMQPTEFSGDFQNPEQRVGQIGLRFSF